MSRNKGDHRLLIMYISLPTCSMP